jgi:hypothetical protein
METAVLSPEVDFVLLGTILNPTARQELEIHHDSLLGESTRTNSLVVSLADPSVTAVDEDGSISHFETADTAASKALLAAVAEEKIIELGETGWLLPSFIDTHSTSEILRRVWNRTELDLSSCSSISQRWNGAR